MKEIKVKEIAFGQAGDKGDKSNVFLIPYDEDHYELILDELTEDRAKKVYDPLIEGDVDRYELPGIKAINYVMHQALDGGVSESLNMDPHGKNRAALMLNETISVPDEFEPPETVDGQKEWVRIH